jgi:predicted Zn-dependent protease
MMSTQPEENWLEGRASLGAVTGWKSEEIRLVAELGYALAELGRHAEAITVFEGLAALAPGTAYFQSALGALKLRVGNPEQALAHLNAVLSVDPSNLAALVNRGEAYLNLGHGAAAVNSLQAALKISPLRQEETKTVIRARALLAHLA